jgi:preprotein translocase subunit SecG
MKMLLKILKTFFVFLGVIFFIIIIGLSYLWFADPFDIKKIYPQKTHFSQM